MAENTPSQLCCPPDRDPAPLPADPALADQELALLARALGHPARVRILRRLLGSDACVAGSLVDDLPLAASTVSQHLKVLKEAGLVKGEVDGPRRFYCADRSVVARLSLLLEALP
jgi:DNA-binding transcriptional ArsR family regulator